MPARLRSPAIQPKPADREPHRAASPNATPPVSVASRFRPALGWVILAILFLWQLTENPHVPDVVLHGVGVAGCCYVAIQLVTFTRWNDELDQLPKFLIIFAAAVAELFVENFFVWVVAASDGRKYDKRFIPLQDNVALFFRRHMRTSALLKAFVTWRWAYISNFLLAFLAVPFSVLWDQVPYSGFAIAARALLMHVIVRVVRTVAFLATVLPNSRKPLCYASRFPPVPKDFWEYMQVGLSTLRGFGGCNDLILSGHACTWLMAVMVTWTYYPVGITRYAVLAAYIQTSIRTAVEGWHYSVDFILPLALSWFVWKDLDWVCPAARMLRVRKGAGDPVSKAAIALICAALVFAAAMAFFVGA